MPRATTIWFVTIVAAFEMHLAAAGGVSQSVPVPGGTVAVARSLGVMPAPERARFVAELARLTHFSAGSPKTTRARAASMLAVSPDVAADTVPIPLTVAVWSQAVFRRPVAAEAIVAAILSDSRAAHLCYGLAGVDDETLRFFVDHPALITELYEHDAAAFAAFGESLHVQANRVLPPGGSAAAILWEAAVGEKPDRPEAFVRALFGQQEGRLAYLYDTIAQLDAPRAAFALGLWIKDPPTRTKRFKALAEANRIAFPQWQPAKLPFTRPLHDVGSMLSRVHAEPDGSPSFPALRSWWTWAFENADLPPASVRVSDAVGDDGPVDAAWLAQVIVSADTRSRAERLDQFAFGQRAFGAADRGNVPDVLMAIRAFQRYRMLMLTLERIGVRRASLYVLAARRAQQLSRIDGHRAFAALGQFQGALALVARMAGVRTFDLATAESLITSLSSVSSNSDGRYAGAIASWIERELRTALTSATLRPEPHTTPVSDDGRHVGPEADDGDMEGALLSALAGARAANRQPTPAILWEGQRYRLDLPGSEAQRLRRVREKQESLSVDLALHLLDIAGKLTAVPLPLNDVSAAGAALKRLSPAFAARNASDARDTSSVGVEGLRRGGEIIDRAIEDLARITSQADAQRAARVAPSLAGLVDDVLADALVSWAYAIAIADADSPVLITGHVTRRHDFGFGSSERGARMRLAWALPKQEIVARIPWHISGSLLGLDVALSSQGLRRVNAERVVDPPALSANERDAFAVSVALLDPFVLRDEDRDAIADAVARGRVRVASIAGDSGNVDQITDEIQMDGWRRRALRWTIANEPQRVGSMFSLTELLYLGRAPIADLNAWGASAIVWSGCVCTRLAPPTLWRLLSGRPQLGLMAATIPDLNLHVALMLRELQLPAAIAKAVLAGAVQDFIDESRPTDFNDWLTLVRAAQAVSRERIEDYVAAVTATGPLVPEAPADGSGQP
jgi:hypothetical protein